MKWHAKQDLQRQTGLNSGVTELLLPPALAARRRFSNHFRIKPDRQRSTPRHAFIVRRPIIGLIPRRGPTAHCPLLSRWIHTVNSRRPFVQQSPVKPSPPSRVHFRSAGSVALSVNAGLDRANPSCAQDGPAKAPKTRAAIDHETAACLICNIPLWRYPHRW